MLRAFNLEMLFSVCCVPIDCVGETILRGECFLRKELVYLGVKTSVETAGEAWYNLLLVSIYFNLLLTLIRSHTVAWRLQFTVCIIYMLQWAVFLLRWDIRWVLLRWFEIYAVFLLRFVLRRGRLHTVYGRGRVWFLCKYADIHSLLVSFICCNKFAWRLLVDWRLLV